MENTVRPKPFMEYFKEIDDPRVVGRGWHKLFDILFITVAASIAACDEWKMIVLWAQKNEPWLRKYCELPNGIPSRFVFMRVFQRLNPETFHKAFVAWMKEMQTITAGDVVAVDGKTLRRSFDRADGKGAIHMVSAWSNRNQMVLGQIKVEDKSNEITAIPELLRLLEIKGALVTIDAMGCQKEIAAQIVEQGGDYLLAVKDNQPTLFEDVRRPFEEGNAGRRTETEDVGHGRLEIREYWQTSDLSGLRGLDLWPGLKTLGRVRRRCLDLDGKIGEENRYYISSLPLGVKRMASGIRGHWGIENKLHYVLDMSFDEDRRRIRKGDSAENMGTVRHVVMNYVSQAKHLNCGIKNRRLLAAIDVNVLQEILRI